MAPKIQKFTNHHFFPTSNYAHGVPAKPDRKPTFVDVGGKCGFRAIAAGLIDNFKTHPRMKGDLLNKILACHFSNFPTHRTTMPGLVKASERMEQLIKQVRMSELLPLMAKTLLQIADIEVRKNPQLYPDAFVERNKWTTSEEMHKLTTSKTAALANALGMSIVVLVVERLKTLHKRLHYNPAGAVNPPVVMKLQGDHYLTRVTSNCFASLRQQPMDNAVRVPLLPETLEAVDAEEKRLVAVFADAYNRLAVMITAGELSKDDLLTVYVKNVPYMAERGLCVDFEYGNQTFFEAIMSAHGCIVKEILPFDEHDAQLTNELAHALARAISLGMSEDNLFSQIEAKQDARNCRTFIP